MIANQTYFINSTKNTISSQFTTDTQISLLSYLYWIYKRLECRTWDAIATLVFFYISLPQLVQLLVFSLFMIFMTQMSRVPFDMGWRKL